MWNWCEERKMEDEVKERELGVVAVVAVVRNTEAIFRRRLRLCRI